MTVKDGIEIAAVLVMIGGLMIGGLAGVLRERMKRGRGIGVREIQFLVVIFVFPVILILALEGVLKAELVGTLLGTTTWIRFIRYRERGNPERQTGDLTTQCRATNSLRVQTRSVIVLATIGGIMFLR